MARDLREAIPGRPIFAADFNRVVDNVEQAVNITAEAPLEIELSGAGINLRYEDGILWGQVTGSAVVGGAEQYSWQEVYPNGDGTWTAPTGGRGGTTSTNFAYERNGVPVPFNAIVRLYPDALSNYVAEYGEQIYPTTVTWSTNQNNYSLGQIANWLQADVTTGVTLTGIAAPTTSTYLFLSNTGSGTLTIADESSSSTAANRIHTGLDDGAVLAPGETGLFLYDTTAARWRFGPFKGIPASASYAGLVSLGNQYLGSGRKAADSLAVAYTAGSLGDNDTLITSQQVTLGGFQYYLSQIGAVGPSPTVYLGTGLYNLYILDGSQSSLTSAAANATILSNSTAGFTTFNQQNGSAGTTVMFISPTANLAGWSASATTNSVLWGGYDIVAAHAFGVGHDDSYTVGVTGTGGAGDKFSGGVCWQLGGGATLTVGSSVVSGGTTDGLLYSDGHLQSSADVKIKSGYLVQDKGSTPGAGVLSNSSFTMSFNMP